MTTRPEDERPRRRAAAPLAGAVFVPTAGFDLLLATPALAAPAAATLVRLVLRPKGGG